MNADGVPNTCKSNKNGQAMESVGGVWLSLARVVKCWVKSRNEWLLKKHYLVFLKGGETDLLSFLLDKGYHKGLRMT